MKNIAFLICTLFASFLSAQEINFLTKKELTGLDLKNYQVITLNGEEQFKLDNNKDIFVDFQLRNIPDGTDSMIVVLNEKLYPMQVLSPFIIQLEGEQEVFNLDVKFYRNGTLISEHKAHNTEILVSTPNAEPSIVDDRIVFGLLMVILALIFYTSSLKTKFWSRLYLVLPALLLCYLIPAIFNSMGLISDKYSGLYDMAKDYLLPAALILMTIGIDFKGIINLGPKALIMFFTATVGIIIGGPIAILVFKYIDPQLVGGIGDAAAWKGFATLAGSWIGGGANQAAMLETYGYSEALYGKMVTVDIVVANLWMAFLLWAAARSEKIDQWLKADASSIEELKTKVSKYQLENSRIATLTDYMVIIGITFGIVAVSHYLGNLIAPLFDPESPFASSFLWLVVFATTGGLICSFTRARKYEGAGAMKIGSVFIYILVATIGMKMELHEAIKEPMLILVGVVWMLVHVALLFIVAKIIKAPFFFVAVGSKANVGGAASAPVVAAAFHPSLASVGALLAVLGYAIGTYGAIVCAKMMEAVAP